MFRNHRNLFTSALILALFLLTSLPAAAAGASQMKSGEGAWENLVSRVLSWLGGPGSGLSALWGEYSSMIDPNGQPTTNTTNSDYSSYIDPLGRP
jgi:hypothetical protein